MILTAEEIRAEGIVDPCLERRRRRGLSCGLSACGYDVRSVTHVAVQPGKAFTLDTVEIFRMPTDVVGFVHPKSSWARLGMHIACGVVEPGWTGRLTICGLWFGNDPLSVEFGSPIAQVVFHRLPRPVKPYDGRW